MFVRIGLASALLLLTLGCGGPGSFNGEVTGIKLAVNDAAFVPVRTDTGEIWGTALVLTDVADLCADMKALRDRKNATYLSFSVFRTNGSSSGWPFLSPDKGTYTVIDGNATSLPTNFAYSEFWKNDANCQNVVASDRSDGRSGTVDVESIAFQSDGSMTGKFDVTFGVQADKVTGTFNASYCDPPTATTFNCE